MKHGWVTALSVAGVIGAGAAAVVANSTVFAGASGDDASVVPLEQVVQEAAVSPIVTVVYDRSAAPTVTTGATTTATAEVDTVPTATTQAYEVGTAGLVELRHDGSTITVVTAAPNPGWRVVSTSPPGASVQVVFAGADQQVRFTASLAGGQVAVAVEASDIRPPTSAQPTPSTSAARHDDDDEHDDDEHDDEEHEDEEHEDEEHEGRDEDD